MNNKSDRDRWRLLNEVLNDESETLQKTVLAEFRRARLIRHLSVGARIAAALALLAGGVFWFHQSPPAPAGPMRSSKTSGTRAIVSSRPSPVVQDTPVRLISDEELVAAFPPDSCFIAEVDGRKILVFRDPAVRDRFFRF